MTETTAALSAGTDQRFWAQVKKTDTCWLWTSSLTTCGYGTFWTGSRRSAAHRWAYERFIGPIPEGMELDHLCRVRHCVNPAHVEPVTHAENMRRSGPFSPKAALTHCKNGHEFTPENTYPREGGRSGRRACRACNRQAQRAYRARKAARGASGGEAL